MEGGGRRGGRKSPALTLKLPESPVAHLGGRKEQQWPASEGRCWPGFHGPETGPAPHPRDFLLVCNPFPPSQRDHLCQQVGTAMACVSPEGECSASCPGDGMCAQKELTTSQPFCPRKMLLPSPPSALVASWPTFLDHSPRSTSPLPVAAPPFWYMRGVRGRNSPQHTQSTEDTCPSRFTRNNHVRATTPTPGYGHTASPACTS